MNTRNALLIAAVGGLASLAGAAATGTAAGMGPREGMGQCFRIARAGMNDCAANGHACAGKASADGDKREWVLVPKGTCEKIVGGSLKPKA